MQNEETLVANIKINNEDAQKKLDELQNKLDKAKLKLDNLTKEGANASKSAIKEASKEVKNLNAEYERQKKIIIGLYATTKDFSNISFKKLNESLNALKDEIKSGNIKKGTKEWEKHKEAIQKCYKEIDEYNKVTRRSTSKVQKLIKALNVNWGAITQIFATVTGVSMTIRKAVGDYAEMEQKMADVRKYTGQTDEQVREMNEDFKKMDTRTSREQLNELAGAAGRLGLTAKDDIEEFVDAANKIGVALGDDLGKDAVDTIGKLAIAFGESDRLGLRQAMLATGSALNDIVQNSSAQAKPAVEFTKALSGVGQQAHMTQAQIMGFASALDQNNQEMATSSTVMSQLITKMYQDPAKFAKMAGLDVQKFSELIKNYCCPINTKSRFEPIAVQ